jgi:putative membrane protein
MGEGLGMGFGGFMWLLWILLIAGLVWLVAAFVRPSDHRKSALEILEERYARGEIEREEFERRKADLTQ